MFTGIRLPPVRKQRLAAMQQLAFSEQLTTARVTVTETPVIIPRVSAATRSQTPCGSACSSPAAQRQEKAIVLSLREFGASGFRIYPAAGKAGSPSDLGIGAKMLR